MVAYDPNNTDIQYLTDYYTQPKPPPPVYTPVAQRTPAPVSPPYTGGGGYVAPNVNMDAGGGGFTAEPGYGFDIMEATFAQEARMQQMAQSHQMVMQQIDIAAQMQLAQANRDLQMQLQRGQIDHERYLQQRELKQRESEFARQLALNKEIFKHQQEMDEAQLELNRLAEVRQERALQAQLAANPEDFVAYEYYKRMLGQPNAWDAAQQEAGGGTTQGGVDSTSNALGTPYEEAPPAYDDETIQGLASALFSNQNGDALYNPALSGKGAFGATIQGPNELSRAEAMGLTDTELGILSSFLNAGVEMGPTGKRVSLDPKEWLEQSQRSWIPTLNEAQGAPTVYR